jgi:hypothetical protein
LRHEFRGREVGRERQATRRAAERRRVTLLDDGTADIAGLRFVGRWRQGSMSGICLARTNETRIFVA